MEKLFLYAYDNVDSNPTKIAKEKENVMTVKEVRLPKKGTCNFCKIADIQVVKLPDSHIFICENCVTETAVIFNLNKGE